MTRRRSVRLLLCLVGLVALVAVGTAIERTTSIVSATIQPHIMAPKWNSDAAKSSELDQISSGYLRRIDVKDKLVADLVAGRATLTEVTAQFCDLNREREDCRKVISLSYRGASEREATARNVLEYSAGTLAGMTPIQRALVSARLEFQLWELLTQDSFRNSSAH